MRAPLDPKLLHDRKFINIAEAFVNKKLMGLPEVSKKKQIKYLINQSKQGKDLTLNVLG
jgi:hypothetical protein